MSKFQYSGFISYRNGRKNEDDLLNSFAKQFYIALRSELKAQIDIDDLFLDIHHLPTGAILNATISKGICTAVCYIVIFTRNYLSKSKLYCAAELMGMLECEKKRLALLGWENPSKGFVFTVVLNSPDRLPNVLKENRIYYDFSQFTLAEIELKRNPKYVEKFKELATAIADLYEEMEDVKAEILVKCNDFAIKDVNEEKQVLEIEDFINKHIIDKKYKLQQS